MICQKTFSCWRTRKSGVITYLGLGNGSFFIPLNIHIFKIFTFVEYFPYWGLNSHSIKIRRCKDLCFIFKELESYSITKDCVFIMTTAHSPEVKSQFVISNDLCKVHMSTWKYRCLMAAMAGFPLSWRKHSVS